MIIRNNSKLELSSITLVLVRVGPQVKIMNGFVTEYSSCFLRCSLLGPVLNVHGFRRLNCCLV